MDLDHVAIATHDAGPVLDALVGAWGATIVFGGATTGFRPVTLRMGEGDEGMSVEVLEPWDVEHNDFLERYIARHGEGPHHITFKVDDLAAEIERVRAHGYEPIQIDLESPTWKEAFIHPKQAFGTVVQLAQSSWPNPGWPKMIEFARDRGPNGHQWWPDPPLRNPNAAIMKRAVMSVPDVSGASDLFSGLLGGSVEIEGEGWLQLRWPGGSRLRLEQNPERSPGIIRFECVHAESPDEIVVGGTTFRFTRQ